MSFVRETQAALRAKQAILLSRQRIVGATSGSSLYVLSLMRVLRDAGYAVHFRGVSPKLFGRWPLVRLRAEMRVFETIGIRGGTRLGRWFWCTNPIVYARAFVAGLERLLVGAGLLGRGWTRRAEDSLRAVSELADALYVAEHTQQADVIVCDYAFLTPLARDARSRPAPILVIMHDLMSSNAADAMTAYALDATEEFQLLSQADAIVAIQPEEAAVVRSRLPETTTLLAPCAVNCVSEPQPGAGDELLFIGSNTFFNAEGLEWFLAQCWPAIRARRPDVRLRVVGSVCRRLGALPEGVVALGVIDDLRDVYASAGVVIVPLLGGAGLKIKLVEALGAGKSVVATAAATKGVEDYVTPAVIIEDEADRFAGAVLVLLDDRSKREALGRAALAAASRHFSEAQCYEELRQWLGQQTRSDAIPASRLA
ncbi:MAG: glycosyltransferase family 4 protein [Hyphomonadaceae bacterium]|nr:glycosyltransferase family 4 protein [Hyphomonadaceae bacterium]